MHTQTIDALPQFRSRSFASLSNSKPFESLKALPFEPKKPPLKTKASFHPRIDQGLKAKRNARAL
jgi:hypothetical protein